MVVSGLITPVIRTVAMQTSGMCGGVGRAQDTFPLNLRTAPGDLDTNAVIQLWDCIHRSPRVEFLLIDSVYFRPFIQNHPKLRFDQDTARVHATHFHVRILDPDGNN